MPTPRIKLVISFDGTAYCGWKSQRSGCGVEDHVRKALAKIVPNASPLESSSRTDSGVHARALVAHFDSERADAARLALALNALLPPDIRIVSATRVGENFHARFGAVEKEYRYHIWNAPATNPLRLHDVWHVPQRLDLAAMNRAAEYFIGRHDFTAFTSKRDGTLGDPFRTVTRCSVARSGGLVTIRVVASGFLYKMCRAITGTLVAAGRENISPEEIPRLISAKNRRATPMNAPAHGLVLWAVRYR